MNLFRHHALAFDEFACPSLMRKAADDLVRFRRIAGPMHLRSPALSVCNKLQQVRVEVQQHFVFYCTRLSAQLLPIV